MELHLETSLNPQRFAELLAKVPHPMLKVNYDSGNSSSLGYHPRDEFAAYGEPCWKRAYQGSRPRRWDRAAGDRRRRFSRLVR